MRFAKRNPPLDIFDFPRKSFAIFYFPDRASWLALALDTLFWRVSRTIVGTGFGDGSGPALRSAPDATESRRPFFGSRHGPRGRCCGELDWVYESWSRKHKTASPIHNRAAHR